MKTIFKNSVLLFLIYCYAVNGIAQINYGKIVYERKSNLYKKYKDYERVKSWLKEENKTKTEIFELYFNDSLSFFKPLEGELKDRMSWATNKNTIYQNFKTNDRLTIKKIWGEKLYVQDTLYKRQWKITNSKRTISGYSCRKAIWQANDSTRIYAWYCDEIIPSVGPESFYGLPGAILGLASEDGGVIYFAKSVEIQKPDTTLFVPQKGKNKIYTPKELRMRLEKEFGKEKWGEIMIQENFGLW